MVLALLLGMLDLSALILGMLISVFCCDLRIIGASVFGLSLSIFFLIGELESS